jgi:hypothetical protein
MARFGNELSNVTQRFEINFAANVTLSAKMPHSQQKWFQIEPFWGSLT